MTAIPLNLHKLKAIVFDLDNTLVSSNMDFKWLRSQIGCPLEQDVLDFADNIRCPNQRADARQMILQHELDDAESSYPMPGCEHLLSFIADNALYTAIITRNCAQAARAKVTANALEIERIISREHYAPKPAPDALLALVDEWQIMPDEMLYVGDYLYDLQAANNALMPSCLVTHGRENSFSNQASLVVEHLTDLRQILEFKASNN
ncbi:HAD family hydrolase [Vibrio sp. LaRot3]|uniref:HAD family hydrolase n=1 Tax=Vibrio sp. LaRot3 TaxID=2998829 RepID=UPI0022CDE646|nr:HAD hydrolase-like protein [Vibrio sp. LaRot3]MDA0150248.1 HAD hydrolase-like protein [Vibrio sp. LaRot3]